MSVQAYYDRKSLIDPIGLTEINNTPHDRLAHCRNPQ